MRTRRARIASGTAKTRKEHGLTHGKVSQTRRTILVGRRAHRAHAVDGRLTGRKGHTAVTTRIAEHVKGLCDASGCSVIPRERAVVAAANQCSPARPYLRYRKRRPRAAEVPRREKASPPAELSACLSRAATMRACSTPRATMVNAAGAYDFSAYTRSVVDAIGPKASPRVKKVLCVPVLASTRCTRLTMHSRSPILIRKVRVATPRMLRTIH